MNKLSTAILIGILCLSMFSVFTMRTALSSSSEGPILEWDRTYGGSSADFAGALIQTMDGGYAMAGRRMSGGGWDFWFFKVNATGDEQWERTYGGSNAAAYSVVQTGDGGYALAGYTNDGYIWLVRTDAYGNLDWSKTYGGTYREQAYSLIQTRDGGFAMVGFRHLGGSSPYDFYFLKTDENGAKQWENSFGGLGDDVARSVVETADGYLLAGYKDASDFWLVKTDSDGIEMWNKTYGGIGTQNAYSLAITNDGGYVIAGWTDSLGAGGKDFWLVKTDTYGNMIWNKTYGGPYDEWAHSVIHTADGGYALVGYTDSFGASGHDFWLVKTDEDGNIQWTSRYGKEYDDYAFSVIQTNDGGYAIAGGVALYSPIPPDAWLIKLAPERILATINTDPGTLNLGSKGNWITAFVELSEGYDVNEINVSSMLLNDTIAVDLSAPTTIGDHDGDGVPDLMVKFNRTKVEQYILSSVTTAERFMNVALTITGKFYDETCFNGSGTIKVVMPMPKGAPRGTFDR